MSTRSWSLTLMFALLFGVTRAIAEDPGINISNHSAFQIFPSISGGRVVWSDWRTPHSSVYLYEILSGSTARVTPADALGNALPTIGGDQIAYGRLTSEDDWELLWYDIPNHAEHRFSS